MRIARRTLRTALLVAFIAFAFPQLVGLPFLSQNPVILQAALMVSRNLLFIELACAIVATVAGIILGRANQPWRKLAFGVAACVLLSRLDIYELLFHPLQTPAFISAADTKLDAREKVLAVSIKGHIRAYPVRSLSYHHRVNDVLEGVAVAATY